MPTLVLAALVSALPPVTYVDANLATGANDGSSWANAYRGSLGLKAALEAGAKLIWVADGTYYPGPVGSPATTSFVIAGDVSIRGGFAGGETDPSEADPALHPAILSGDLPGGPAGQPELEAIVRLTSTTNGPTLRGLTLDVTLGSPNASTIKPRRALVVTDCNGPLIRDCILRDGRASKGGGVLITNSTVSFQACTVTNNTADEAGGGVFSDRTSESYFNECLITNNTGGLGAGIYFGAFGAETAGGAFPGVARSTFANNLGVIGNASGGGIYCRWIVGDFFENTFLHCIVPGGGGGVFSENSNVVIERCRFIDCAAAGDGGGGFYANNTTPSVTQTAEVTNSLFTGNHNALFAANGAEMDVEHCTIVNGRPQSGQPLFFPAIVATGTPASEIALRNCIIWGNAALNGAPVGGNALALGSSKLSFQRCIAQGWSGPVGNITGSNNISVDPLFLDIDGLDGVKGTTDDDLRLRLNSPCIDAADSSIIELPWAFEFDLDGNARPFDLPLIADTGAGRFPFADIGCHERSPVDCLGDLTFDGIVNGADLAALLGEWGNQGSIADLDDDGDVGASDLALLLGAFGLTCQ